MNYREALPKLERLLEIANDLQKPSPAPDRYYQFSSLYGELEDFIARLIPPERVSVNVEPAAPEVFNNYIEAGFCASYGVYQHAGYRQLLKLVGKVRQLSDDPTVPRNEASITAVAQSLRRFRECCQYLVESPSSERAVQDIVWVMLRAQFDRVDREDTLPKFGVKSYRPDFGVPDARALIEIKFVGPKTELAEVQEQLLADIRPYLHDNPHYDAMLLFVYDHAQKLRDSRKFIEDLRTIEQVADVIVIPGISAA